MGFDGLDAAVKLVGDLVGAEAEPEQVQNFELAFAQASDRAGGASLRLGGMEAADMLGISEPTIRTHLQHIFSKTGTSKQANLLRLLHNSTPPIYIQQTTAH